jgi:hypothetical protein
MPVRVLAACSHRIRSSYACNGELHVLECASAVLTHLHLRCSPRNAHTRNTTHTHTRHTIFVLVRVLHCLLDCLPRLHPTLDDYLCEPVPAPGDNTASGCAAMCCADAQCKSFSFNAPWALNVSYMGCVHGKGCCCLKSSVPPLEPNSW